MNIFQKNHSIEKYIIIKLILTNGKKRRKRMKNINMLCWVEKFQSFLNRYQKECQELVMDEALFQDEATAPLGAG